METDRARLARWITGAEIPAPPWTADDTAEALVGLAAMEGVTCLLEWSQRGRFPASEDAQEGRRWMKLLRDAARKETLASMMLEGETRRVLGVLRDEGLQGLLLKGSALAYWAYPEPHLRACGDIDVLLASRQAAEQLAKGLVAQGYVRANPSGDLVAHELMCTRQMTPEWALEVDIHWRLNNTTLFARAFDFDELLATSIPVPRLAPDARGLGQVHALIHAAVHRARNLANGVGDGLKWLYDVHLLVVDLDHGDWERVVDIARSKQLAGVVLSALLEAQRAFGCVFPASVAKALGEAALGEPLDMERLGDWRYMQSQTLRSLPGLGARLRWLWQRVFPSGDYMRYLYGTDASYGSLLLERGRRFWTKWRQR